ncbi:MAG: hypothetical protein GXP63_04815 [DPANN group archaeon]|nr:hypothetical protein [DPANN group archaeon]
MAYQLSDQQLRSAFSNIKRDMQNMKTTLQLQRSVVEHQMQTATSSVMASVEKRFFNGHGYITQEAFDKHLEQLLIQMDPVHDLLRNIASLEENVASIGEQQTRILGQQEEFITEKDAQFLLETMDRRLHEIDMRIPSDLVSVKMLDTIRKRHHDELRKAEQGFSRELVSVKSQFSKEVAALRKKIARLETGMVDRRRLLRSLQ